MSDFRDEKDEYGLLERNMMNEIEEDEDAENGESTKEGEDEFT